MHDYLASLLLGTVEGLTEFLPVSSTAHLRITEALLHISLTSGYWKMYAIVIQIGAVLSLPIYFHQRILQLVRTFPGVLGGRRWLTHPLSLTGVAFIVTAVPTYFLTKVIGEHLESLAVMGWSLVAGGIVMWSIDAANARSETAGPGVPGRVRTWRMDEMSLAQSIWIGACQILSAVFPGTSRSMATIAAGQVAGMSRRSALEFSFFLSMPTMAAATGYDLLKSLSGRGENPIGVSHIDAHGWAVLAVGLITAFVVAYATVAWFLDYVTRRGFAPFAVYRLAAGAAVLAFLT
jgi:undecaprenyl-diphosphatase